jgi:GntR family transcriptional regulator
MSVAPYQRVAAEIRRRIATSAWPPGYQILSQAQLAAELGVTVAEARRGMSVLRRAGELEGEPRRRLFVAHPPAVRTLIDADGDWPHRTGDGEVGTCRATTELARRLAVTEGTRLQWERTECLDPDHRPSHLITSWWAGRRASTWAGHGAEAELHTMTSQEAEQLGLGVGVPAWRVIRTRYDAAGQPVETADLILPADRWRLRVP